MTITKPLIAVALGDPGGIGPELAVKLAASRESHELADLVLIGDRHVIALGEQAAGVKLDLMPLDQSTKSLGQGTIAYLPTDTIDQANVTVGRGSIDGSRSSLASLTTALELAQGGGAIGVLMMPMSDTAPADTGLQQNHLAAFIGHVMDLDYPAWEVAAMSSLWVTSVTGKTPISEVPARLSEDRVLETCRIMHGALRSAGLHQPRIALTGLNPLIDQSVSADGEDREMIAPAIARAVADGMDCEGPFTAETIFKHALSDGIDAIITMYNDQARIATSLMGFEQGLTFFAGLPFPIMGPAQPPAYEIAGKGEAECGASTAALNLLLSMAIERGPAFRYRGDSGRERQR